MVDYDIEFDGLSVDQCNVERVKFPLSAGNKKVKTESGLNFALNIVRSISTEPCRFSPQSYG